MIKSVRINGFKCLLQKENIPTKALNVLVGANASGKSSFIQSLLLLRQSMNGDGKISALNLSGYLYEAGTAQDVLHPEAEHKILMQIETEAGAATIIFKHDRNDEAEAPRRSIDAETGVGFDSPLFDEVNRFAYLNAERVGPRVTYPLPPEKPSLAGLVGKHGEYTAAVLARRSGVGTVSGWSEGKARHIANSVKEIDSYNISDEIKNSQGRLDIVCNEMLGWIIPGATFDASESVQTDSAALRFVRDPLVTKTTVRATHVGFGLAYTLPIIVAALSLGENGILIVENPEAHLQPFSQSRIGVFLAIVASLGHQVFLETHSDHVINGVRLAAKHGVIDAENVAINYFCMNRSSDVTEIEQISVDVNGYLAKWPVGFLDQIENDLSRL